jgi:iron complex transport system substrate-binding protein
MKGKYFTYVAVVVAIAAILSAAFIYMSMQNQVNNLENSQKGISVWDDEGTVVTLDSAPQRIVSLAPSNTQILFAIGVGNRVVGVTEYDNWPYDFAAWIAAGNMTSIGGFSTPNKEAIASLHPDLILATIINDPDVVTLRSMGYKVLVLNPDSIVGVMKDILLVGTATGAEDNATSLVNSLNSQIDTITAKIAAANIVEKPKVYYEIYYNPTMTAGSTSFINDVIKKAGGINIFENETQQWPTISSETVVQMNPDVILLPTSMGTSASYGSVDEVKARPGWSSINAVKNNRIIVIDVDLFAEAGPRIADQIAAVAKGCYPDLFNSP